jgi:hypothetical protein
MVAERLFVWCARRTPCDHVKLIKAAIVALRGLVVTFNSEEKARWAGFRTWAALAHLQFCRCNCNEMDLEQLAVPSAQFAQRLLYQPELRRILPKRRR